MLGLVAMLAGYALGQFAERRWPTQAKAKSQEPDASEPIDEGPYRTKVASELSELSEKIDQTGAALAVLGDEQRICKKCSRLEWRYPLIMSDPFCRTGPEYVHPVDGLLRRKRNPRKKNRNFDCPDFERKSTQ